jgi:hypothetical protein
MLVVSPVVLEDGIEGNDCGFQVSGVEVHPVALYDALGIKPYDPNRDRPYTQGGRKSLGGSTGSDPGGL